ncbi:MAG: 3-oxoacyl-ACP synthase III [Verrucomicrobiota bacterium]|nr:3-oxoacyl-ACP synthase III [Verrucomicrobiota bacterium]
MKYKNVYIRAFAYELPSKVVTSAEIEERLSPLYKRLNLPKGRLELMSGIKERRFWPTAMMPSEGSIKAGKNALKNANLSSNDIDCIIHCSVSRDCVEPATASIVHEGLGLRPDAINFDISNACLGIASGIIAGANMIELGQCSNVLLVAGENGRPLVENTINQLLSDKTLTRKTLKPYFASLTIGSAAVAVVLTGKDPASKHKLIGGVALSDTRYNNLCRGDADKAMTVDSAPQMSTDSEELLNRGIDLAEKNWAKMKKEFSWQDDTPDIFCCHQVGRAHRNLLYSRLNINPEKDFPTVQFLGNCGSVSMPITVAIAEEQGSLNSGDILAMLGIGSGINSLMLAIKY